MGKIYGSVSMTFVLIAVCLALLPLSTAEAQWIPQADGTFIHYGPPVRPGGNPTISVHNPATGQINQSAEFSDRWGAEMIERLLAHSFSICITQHKLRFQYPHNL